MDPVLENIAMSRESPMGRDTVRLRSNAFVVVLGFGPHVDDAGEPARHDGRSVFRIWVPDRAPNEADGDREIDRADLGRLVRDIRSACERDGIACIVRLPDHTYVGVDGRIHRWSRRDEKKLRFPEALRSED